MLCDTGPLVALCDESDPDHARSVAEAQSVQVYPLRTTYPCFTEAMHLLKRTGGWRSQAILWELVTAGVLQLDVPAEGELVRMRELMTTYADAPMDFADASLVAAAERLRELQMFTMDSHFYAYRQKAGHAFNVVP